MNLDEAVQLALDGDAILFLGAGFSAGLRSAAGQTLPTAKEFALELAAAAGNPGIDDLDTASQEYLDKFSDYHLAEFLRTRFRLSSATQVQETLAGVPWLRVYTTNYDNAFEVACRGIKKPVRPVTTDERLSDLPQNELWCVHINGFIDRLTNSYIDSQIRLTNASYLTASFAENIWSTHFRQDIDVARVLIVVGYSLYDLDIARILYRSQGLPDKTLFVTRPNPAPSLQARLRRMGSVFPVGVEFLSNEVERIRPAYTPRARPPLFSCLRSLHPTVAEATDRLRDDDVLDLLLRGSCSLPLLRMQSASAGSKPYIIPRVAANEALRALKTGRQAVLMHSDLGNGKSITTLELAVQLTAAGWSIYALVKRRDGLLSELNVAAQLPGPKLFIIDGCYNYLDEIAYLANRIHQQVHVLLLSRTAAHELRAPQLFQVFPETTLLEIDMNRLLEDDISHAVNYLDIYGLWAEYASLSEERKRDVIVNGCAGEMQAVLLVILRSPVVRERFQSLFDRLEQNSELKRSIVLAMILAVCEKDCDTYLLSELLGEDVFRTAEVRRDEVAREFIDLDRGEVRVKSPVVARELLRQSEESKFIVETLIHVIRRLNRLRDDRYFRRLAHELVRFGNLERLLPDADKRDSAVYLYEEVRDLDLFNKDALFWLQYAIARMAFSQYEVAERYFKQSYAIARSRSDFNTFQIDNHYARFLIESRAFGGLPGKLAAFLEADKLLRGQMREEGGSAYYPFRVARKYADFYDRCFQELDDGEKIIFLRACANMLRHIGAGGQALRRYRVVEECRSALQRILAENLTG